jgi:hypothetical protein
MPIARRSSQSDLEAVTDTSFHSGVHLIDALEPEPLALTELTQLHEVWDDDPTTPDIPSLMPIARTRSQEMRAVRVAQEPVERLPELHGGRMLEAELMLASDGDFALELEQHPSRGGISSHEASFDPPASGPRAPIPVVPRKEVDPRPGIVAFAGFGLAPEGFAGAATYAVRVLNRKSALREDLRIARLRRITDVSLYEAALECADESAVTRGIAVITASVVGVLGAIVAAAAVLL